MTSPLKISLYCKSALYVSQFLFNDSTEDCRKGMKRIPSLTYIRIYTYTHTQYIYNIYIYNLYYVIYYVYILCYILCIGYTIVLNIIYRLYIDYVYRLNKS